MIGDKSNDDSLRAFFARNPSYLQMQADIAEILVVNPTVAAYGLLQTDFDLN